MEHQEDIFQAALDKLQVTHELPAASKNTLLSSDSIFKIWNAADKIWVVWVSITS